MDTEIQNVVSVASRWLRGAAMSLALAPLAACAAGEDPTAPDGVPAGSQPVAVFDVTVDVESGDMFIDGGQSLGSLSRALTEITTDSDGVPGTSTMPDVVELVTEDVSSDTSVPDGCPGSYPTTFCGLVRMRSFFETSYLGDAFIEFTSLTGGARLTSGVTNAIGTSGLDFVRGVIRYGVLQPDDGSPYLDSERLWIFDVPMGLSRFSFSAVVWANEFASGRPNLVTSVNGRGSLANKGLYDTAVISENGRYVAFDTYAALSSDDGDFGPDVYRYDRVTGEVILISVNDAGTGSGNNNSWEPAISADGNVVVFTSRASNLVASDVNGNTEDIFARDVNAGTTEIASLRRNGNQSTLSGRSQSPQVSANGCFVAFESQVSNLVGGDTNGTWDSFVRKRCGAGSNTTYHMSVQDDGSSLASGRYGRFPSVSNNGCRAVWQTNANTLDVTGIKDRSSPRSADDVILRDRCAGESTLISIRTAGDASSNGFSTNARISGDGNIIVFQSTSTNLTASDPNGAVSDIFIRNVSGGTTTRVGGNGASVNPHVSRDGDWFSFESDSSDLVGSDGNGVRDVFIHDIGGSSTTRISVSGSDEGDDESRHAYVNDDGSYVVFITDAANLFDHDDNNSSDVIVRRR